MSRSDDEVEDEFSSEKARAEINTPVRSDVNTRRTSGFTGAPVDGNGIMNQEIQTMLQSAKADAKIKGDMFQNIRSSDLNPHKKDPQRSLFGVSYTPTYNENGNTSVENNAVNILRSGFTSGFPWANDLAKLHLPKLTKSDPASIVVFQRKYREYLRGVHELEERYTAKIPPRSVYSCILPRTLHYLCFMTELIPMEHRTDPKRIDRGIIQQVIMNYVPTDCTDFTLQLDEELNKIQIKLWPNGLSSIEDAWNKLFDLDIKYKTTELKPKKTIRILVSNLLPKRASKMITSSMSIGTKRDQDMASDLMLFHRRLIEIAKAMSMASRYANLSLKEGGSVNVIKKVPAPKRPQRERSKAAIKEGGCKWHGKHCTHGTSECYIEHPELAPKALQPYNVEKAKERAKELKKIFEEKERNRHKKEETTGKANVITPGTENAVNLIANAEEKDVEGIPANFIANAEEKDVEGIPANDCIPTLFFTTDAKDPVETTRNNTEDSFQWLRNSGPTCNTCTHNKSCTTHSNEDCLFNLAPGLRSASVGSLNPYAWLDYKTCYWSDPVSVSLNESVKGEGAMRVSIPTKTKGKYSIFTYDFVHKHQHEHQHKHSRKRKHTCVHDRHGLSGTEAAYPVGFKKADCNDVIWDSGASHSIVSAEGELHEKQPPPFKNIKGLSGKLSAVAAVGQYNNVDGVLAVPDASQDLISVGAFLDQKGGKLVFTSQTVQYVPSHSRAKQPSTIGERREDGLYTVLKNALQINSASANLSKAEQDFQLLREKVHMLHRLLGHVGKPKMKSILSKYNLGGLKPHHIDLMTYCEACKVASAKFKPRGKISKNKASKFAERIMSDNSGKLRTRSQNGSKYACVIVDEFTSWIWMRGLKSLTDTYDFVKHVIQVELHQRNDHSVKFFRSDNGTEYVNAAMDTLLSNHGIIRERTCPASSFQNGKAERSIGIIFSMMRKSLYESRLPPTFWLEALQWAVYTYNRIPLTLFPYLGRRDKPDDI